MLVLRTEVKIHSRHTQRNNNLGLNSGKFFKTKICPHFIEGNCRRGDSCNYAHSQTELKEVPNLKKTRICQLYQIGIPKNLVDILSFFKANAIWEICVPLLMEIKN